MKYDDASWHYGGEFPKDLPDDAGATHTGMFLAWCILNDLASEDLLDVGEEDIPLLRARQMTPGEFFLRCCDGKFTDEDISDDAHPFVDSYFSFETGAYLDDYEKVLLGKLPTLYHVPDSWETYDRIAPVISEAHKNYKSG